MGGAQPLAITMNEGVCLAAEVEEWRIKKRLDTKYLDVMTSGIDEGIDIALKAKSERRPLSVGVTANVIDLLERLIKRNIIPDVLTDQTSAHDALVGYLPQGIDVAAGKILREQNPDKYISLALHQLFFQTPPVFQDHRVGR